MKRLFTFLFALLSACTFSAYAEIVNGTCGDNLTWTLNTKDCTLTISGTGKMTNYTASWLSSPAPWSVFSLYIKYVTLPDGLTSIGDMAFEYCYGLTSITIPNSVTSIGNEAFWGCSGLKSVTLGNSVTSIGDYAFYNCSGLTSITIPNSVTSIGGSAFYECRSLTSVVWNAENCAVESSYDAPFFHTFSKITSFTFGDSVQHIPEDLCYEMKNLISITIPNSVISIGDGAFSACSGLTSIIVERGNAKYDSRENCNAIIETATNTLISGCQNTIIPNNVTSIGDGAFSACSGLTSITIPNSVTSIGNEAFWGCSGLTSITIPNSVTSIGWYAFRGCSGLTSITIPNSVTSIGWDAFLGCYSLTSITIPNSVTSIGDGAFSGCSSLTSIIVERGNAKYDSRENCNAIIETATNTLISGCQNTIIPNSVTSIENYAFNGCSGLTSITIPNSVTSIGLLAFGGCSGLTSVILGNSVTSIGGSAFYGCSGLTSVTLGNSVTSIGEWAFYGCKIQEVTSYASTPPAATSCELDQTVCTLYVPADYIDTYSNTLWWEDFKEIRAIAQNEEGADKEFEIVFSDQDNNELSAQSVTLRVPVAPQIAGFTFLYWQPVAAPLDDTIAIQAVYESNTSAAPEVFVNPANNTQKLIRNGQVYILQEDKMYTISGQVVK